MSIFRNTFTQEVSSSLNVRQKAIQRKNPNDIIYLNSRNSWVRMTSGVDVGGTDTLARQYVMLGGVLNTDKTLRKGVGDQSSAYSTYSPSGTPYNTTSKAGTAGLKPMPGITSVDIKSKTAYGSLREVTVNFVCHNLQQLEDLELLYMRPGYTVLVEWGWMPFLDESGNIKNNINFYNGVLDGKASNGKNDRDQIFLDLFQKSKEHFGNYDAHYGYVKNYNWTARMDGGYDCTTTLISVSEILESLRANWIPSDISSIVDNNGLISKYIASPAPTIATTITPSSVFLSFSNSPSASLAQAYSKNILAGLCYELIDTCYKTYQSNNKQPKAFQINSTIENSNIKYDMYVMDLNIPNKPPSELSVFKSSNIQPYITLNSFINLLNERVVLQYADKNDKNKKSFIKISTKQNTYDPGKNDATENPDNNLLCLAHPLQVSIDPAVCLITSPIWATGVDVNGKKVQVDYLNDFEKQTSSTSFRHKKDWSNELGVIGNIYLNISKLYELAVAEQSNGQELKIYPYLKQILAEVQESIGGINTFEIHVDPLDNIPRIIDLNYVDSVDPKTSYKDAFQIEMSNIGSVVRSYMLQSLIFPEQSNLIALGAQMNGSGNQASQNSTLLDFNEGLEDRIMPKKIAAPTYNTNISGSNSLMDSFNKLSTLFVPFDPNAAPLLDKTSTPTSQTYNYKNALKDIIVHFQGITNSKTKNKAIIPVKTSITIDGIGGLIIGHLFKIPPDLLPKGYRISNSGFKLLQVVMGIGHKIENGDWTTTIDAQQIIVSDPKGDVEFKNLIKISNIGEVAKIPGISNSYKNKPEIGSTSTQISRQEIIDYLKYRSDFSINVRRSVLAIFEIESGNGNHAINNNYYGIQTDVGKWAYGEQYFSGTTVFTDNGGNNRRFATFNDYKMATLFMLNTINSRNIVGNNGDSWAKSYVYNWLSPSNPAVIFENRKNELSSIYNNSIKDIPS
jgi:hypothetical protein